MGTLNNLTIFIVLLSVFTSCTTLQRRNRSTAQPIEINEKQIQNGDALMVKHHPRFAKSKFQTKLTILKVKNDSRCPTEVQCKWAGNAEILIEVKHPNTKASTFTLNTNDRMESEVEIDGYYYKLIKLTPYPKLESVILQSSYKAEILVEKR